MRGNKTGLSGILGMASVYTERDGSRDAGSITSENGLIDVWGVPE